MIIENIYFTNDRDFHRKGRNAYHFEKYNQQGWDSNRAPQDNRPETLPLSYSVMMYTKIQYYSRFLSPYAVDATLDATSGSFTI